MVRVNDDGYKYSLNDLNTRLTADIPNGKLGFIRLSEVLEYIDNKSVIDLGKLGITMVNPLDELNGITNTGIYRYDSGTNRATNTGVLIVTVQANKNQAGFNINQIRIETNGIYYRKGSYANNTQTQSWGAWETLDIPEPVAVVQTTGTGTAAVMSQRAVTEELGKRATKSELTGLATKNELTNYVLKSELPTPVVLDGQGEAPLIPGVLGVRVNENGSVMLFQGGRASSLVSHYIRRGAVGETVTTVATKATPWSSDGLEIIPAADATYGYTWEAVVTTVVDATPHVHRITSVAQWMGRTYMRVIVEKIG